VLKGVFTDIGFANTVKAQQWFRRPTAIVAEWGMEQFVRDARINMIYEGANGIPGARPRRPQARQGRRPRADRVLRRIMRPQGEQGGRRACALSCGGLKTTSGQLQQATMWLMQECDGQSRQCGRRLQRLTCTSSA